MLTVEDKVFKIVLVKYYISNKMINNDIIKYKILYLIIIKYYISNNGVNLVCLSYNNYYYR